MKIVFLDSITIGEVKTLSELKKFGDVTIYEKTSAKERINHIADNDIVITNKVNIDKDILDNCRTIKLICVAATGINNIDIEYADKQGIPVKNVAGYSTESVAQFTFSMILTLVNKINYFDHYVKSGQYSVNEIFTHHGREFWELKGKTIGIIGFGTIGKRIAVIAQSFGMDVVYYSTSGKNKNNTDYLHYNLDDLLKKSDIVSIHCPLNVQTNQLIDYLKIKLMKSSALLINTGRGKIVSENDLARALDDNSIAGAAIDVLEYEPIQKDNPLLKIKNKENLLITPHVAWASIESRERLVKQIIKNISEFISSYHSD